MYSFLHLSFAGFSFQLELEKIFQPVTKLLILNVFFPAVTGKDLSVVEWFGRKGDLMRSEAQLWSSSSYGGSPLLCMPSVVMEKSDRATIRTLLSNLSANLSCCWQYRSVVRAMSDNLCNPIKHRVLSWKGSSCSYLSIQVLQRLIFWYVETTFRLRWRRTSTSCPCDSNWAVLHDVLLKNWMINNRTLYTCTRQGGTYLNTLELFLLPDRRGFLFLIPSVLSPCLCSWQL